MQKGPDQQDEVVFALGWVGAHETAEDAFKGLLVELIDYHLGNSLFVPNCTLTLELNVAFFIRKEPKKSCFIIGWVSA